MRREEVDAANDQHVICTPRDFLNAAHAAGGAGKQAGEIACTIADNREGFLCECGKDKLAFLAVGQNLARFRIDNFRIKMILPDNRTVLGLDTFIGNAGPHHF